MQKLKNPFLAISFFVLLFSCASHKVVEGYAPKVPDRKTITVPYFSNPDTDYVYKANITIYGSELTGIFIAKKLDETRHRVVFTTEFGNKLIDFEVSENDFKVNSIVSELDRKIIINTLKTDFRLLLRKHYVVEQAFENPENIVYKSADGQFSNHLFTSKSNGKLFKIVQTSKRKEKINLSFTSENNIFAQRIVITHQNIKLRIEFNYFKS